MLRAFESVSISNPNTTWGLPMTSTGTNSIDRAYGISATSNQPFSIIAWPDSTHPRWLQARYVH